MAESGTPSDAGYRPGYELAAERILELVVADGLRPGDFLGTEVQLAERLGTSRTVVREAVKTLAAIGRVRARKGVGLFVDDGGGFGGEVGLFLPADLEQVDMLFEFRKVQEAAAARLAAARASPLQVRVLRRAADENRAAAETDDGDAFTRTDGAFHRALAEAAHNRFLVATTDLSRRLQRQASLIGLRDTWPGSKQTAAQEHRRIADAVADGDPDAAEVAVIDHLDGTREAYQKRIVEFARLDRASHGHGDEGGGSEGL